MRGIHLHATALIRVITKHLAINKKKTRTILNWLEFYGHFWVPNFLDKIHLYVTEIEDRTLVGAITMSGQSTYKFLND